MDNFSYKYKIYTIVVILAIIAAAFFLFIYGRMNTTNETLATTVAGKRKEYEDLLAEQKSYELGQQDLATLAEKPLQPDDLFSQDTKVVKEIKTLESVSNSLDLKFTLQVAGTVKEGTKLPKTSAQIVTVPYTMVLEGSFDKTMNFIETVQHMPFITNIKAVGMTGSVTGAVRTTLTAEFYIKP